MFTAVFEQSLTLCYSIKLPLCQVYVLIILLMCDWTDYCTCLVALDNSQSNHTSA